MTHLSLPAYSVSMATRSRKSWHTCLEHRCLCLCVSLDYRFDPESKENRQMESIKKELKK